MKNKLLICAILVILLLLYFLQRFYASGPSVKYHRFGYIRKYAARYPDKFVEGETHIVLADTEAAENSINEELAELRRSGVDVDFDNLRLRQPGSTYSLKKPVENAINVRDEDETSVKNPMQNQNTNEIIRKRVDHDRDDEVVATTLSPTKKSNVKRNQVPETTLSKTKKSTLSTLSPTNKSVENRKPKHSFRVRNPEPEDLAKLSLADAAMEKESDPLPESPYCKGEVFLTILVVSAPESVERRKYIRESWAFSYEDDFKMLKWKRPFPNGKVFIPKNVVRVVFVVGKSPDSESNLMDSVQEEGRIHNDIVFGNAIEHYRNLTLKTKLGLKWAYYECKTLYLLKTDDDVFVNPVPLVEWLKKMPDKNFYTGWCNFNSPVVRDKRNKWYVSPEDFKGSKFPGYCLGGGYLMSGDVLTTVIKMSYGRKLFPMEDLYVGLMIDELDGVKPRDERKHFNLIYSGKTKDDCALNSLYLLHRVVGKNLIDHMKQARKAMENC